MKWYIINVYSGSEKKVLEQIYDYAKRNNMSSMFGEVLVPTEEVVEIKKGERVKADRKFFPGYILANMELTDDSWHLVKSIPKVTNFLGSGGKPSPIPASEVSRIRQKIEDSANNSIHLINYEIGESVIVRDGPFEAFQGIIEEVDLEKERLKVSVTIFGRSTNVDLHFSQVERVK